MIVLWRHSFKNIETVMGAMDTRLHLGASLSNLEDGFSLMQEAQTPKEREKERKIGEI